MSTPIENVDEAMRLARTIASDILVYNRDKIADGLAHDDIFDRMATEFEEGQRHFDSRVSASVRAKGNFLERAVVDVLICGSSELPSARWSK